MEEQQKYVEQQENRSRKSEEQYAHLKGIQSHYLHKNYWSWLLMGCIPLMIVFQMVFLYLVGTGKLDFREYDWLLPTFLVQSFGQVIGLAVYAVRSLFRDITGQSRARKDASNT